ncbi:hypothetical protein ACT3TB_11080 [Micrococcaceae sp. AOP34-BR2-30]
MKTMNRATRYRIILISSVVLIVALLGTVIYALSRPAPAPTEDSTRPTTAPSVSESPTPESTRAWQTTSAPATPTDTTSQSAPGESDEAPAEQTLTGAELVTTAAETMTTWDTTSDRSPTDGYRRALEYFVDDYEDIFVTPENPTLPQDWREAAEHNASSTSHAQVTDVYEEGSSSTWYVVVEWTWSGDDGWENTPPPVYWTFQTNDDADAIRNWSDRGLQ